MDKNLLGQYLLGQVDGLVIDEQFLFFAALLMEIPIAMVFLSRVLADRANRWCNVVAGTIKTVVMIATLFIGSFTMYYLFFAVIEITTTAYIVWVAFHWRNDKVQAVN